MQLVPDRVVVAAGGSERAAAIAGQGAVTLGPVEVAVELGHRGLAAWSLANRGDRPLPVRSVSLVWRLVDAVEPLRVFCNGWQSWSPTGTTTFGVDADPSLLPGAHALLRGMHHADPEPALPGELRSELVTVLSGGAGPLLLAGFEGGSRHAGTLRLRPGAGGPELWAEAFLGGAVLDPGESRPLHPVGVEAGDDPAALLAGWAGRAGAAGRARTAAPYQAGWCSWYHYFGAVTEADVLANLALAEDWPFAVFQVDDGFQRRIGDWLTTNERFPSGVDGMAAAIASAGFRPGIWLAPFLASPDSAVADAHPSWFARWGDGRRRLTGMTSPDWGGGVHVLDTTRPEVLEHLELIAAALVEAGFSYLKLDFTYAPALDGVYADRSLTPAERVRAGFDAVRRGAGDEAFVLGCGAPLGPAVGVVDGMRIGPDVAPRWEPEDGGGAGLDYTAPLSTRAAWRNVLTRSFMHRTLWLNDPDCLMLRTKETAMTPSAVHAWALTVGVSGGMALVSDDLALLGPDARGLLDEVLDIGRAADRSAAGTGVSCPDLLDPAGPSRLAAGGLGLVTDPSVPAAQATASTRP